MKNLTVACLAYEICGATQTFDSVEEYEMFNNDWMCPECYDVSEMAFFGWRDIDADHMNSRMADAEMGDL